MISAERIMQYSALEPEAPLETIPPNEKPPDDWPQTGEIAMDDVCFRHSPDTPLVLKNFSCYIRPAEHVCDCNSLKNNNMIKNSFCVRLVLLEELELENHPCWRLCSEWPNQQGLLT